MKTKLKLNQETVRNLTEEELNRVAGGYCTCVGMRTCPECPAPVPPGANPYAK